MTKQSHPSKPDWWSNPRAGLKSVVTLVSVASAVSLAWAMWRYWHTEAFASVFFCAIILSAWFGGFRQALLAVTISVLAFDYYLLPPVHSFHLDPSQLPRLIIFAGSGLVIGFLTASQRSNTESLRRSRDELKGTVQELQRSNEALQAESLERKQAEEALRQAQADLAHVSRVNTMGELTASLAHEVNQPIAAAVTDANTCLRWLTRDHPDVEEACAAAARVVKDATRAAEIISRVRQLFKKSASERELVDPNEVIPTMIALLSGEAAQYNISVRAELAADLPQVIGDRIQLQQVLMNLIVNSIDAMKDVEGTRELVISSRRTENAQVLVSVIDTGVGLPQQHADQIFNAFFTTKSHGTGLGLRISRTIVESHGGRLWAADNPPRGASFCFTLPTKVEAQV
jgi:C4-dicarboxylate-specific signal transduction histidine kinase